MHQPRRLALGLALALPLAMAAPAAGQDQAPATPGGTLPGGPAIAVVQVASGLVDPVNIAHAGDGSDRLFVVQRTGQIRIVDAGGQLIQEPFLDIGNLVKTDFLEQGLLGLAFHPEYADNGRFFVYFSHYSTNGDIWIVEYNVTDDANVADPDSARPIVVIDGDPYTNHNGGTLRFGPDGYLYWSTGDGGSAGDPYDNAQNIRTWFGKLFRIDVDTASVGRPYGIPEDNPFATSSQPQLRVEDPSAYHPGAIAEIWAYGLRNPWQFSFDPETGDLYIADVGQAAMEEIDFQEAGAAGGQNYGWDWLEGSRCYPATVESCPRGQVGVLPVAEIDHARGDCSISGLGVHRGESSAALDGFYFASDYCSGRFWGLARDEGDAWVLQELLDTTLLVTGGGNGEDGSVYATTCSCAFGRDYDPFADPQGGVWRVVSSDEVPDGATTAPPEPEASPAPGGEGSEVPEASAAPEPSAAPEVSAEPEGSAAPEPEASAQVGASAEPQGSEAPEQSAAPEPEPSAVPEGSAAPEASDGVEGSPAADAATVVMVDVDFEPNELSIPADSATEVSLPNKGVALHDFVIDELGIDVAVTPGETGTAIIDAAAGEYVYYCSVPGHREAGMEGTLIVA